MMFTSWACDATALIAAPAPSSSTLMVKAHTSPLPTRREARKRHSRVGAKACDSRRRRSSPRTSRLHLSSRQRRRSFHRLKIFLNLKPNITHITNVSKTEKANQTDNIYPPVTVIRRHASPKQPAESYILQRRGAPVRFVVSQSLRVSKAYLANIAAVAKQINDKTITTKSGAKHELARLANRGDDYRDID